MRATLQLIVDCLAIKCKHHVNTITASATVGNTQQTFQMPDPAHYQWIAVGVLWIKEAMFASCSGVDEGPSSQATTDDAVTQTTPTKSSRSSGDQDLEQHLQNFLKLLEKKPPIHQTFKVRKGWEKDLGGMQKQVTDAFHKYKPSG